MSDEYPYEGATFGDYRLVRGLGHGGFADIYLGTDTTLGKSVAIKVMNTKVPRQEQMSEFKKEARVVAGLEHRHIIEVYRYGIEGTVPYVVMKYAPNGSVRSKYPRGTILPLETIVTYVRQVAEALQYAHDQGLIHRDVKPENMLFGPFGEVLLSDFGIAILTDSRRADPQDIVGTLAYMAPEQFEAKAVRQSDLYSLGIVVYEWLTGDVPFHPTTIFEGAVQHKSWPISSMNRPGVMVPAEVEASVLKALAKDPQNRFNSITDFTRALEATIRRSSVTPTVGAKLWTYRENEAEVLTVAWSPDGSRIMTGNRNGTDRVIDSLTGQTLQLHLLENVPVDFYSEADEKSLRIPGLSAATHDPQVLFKMLMDAKYAHVAISNGCDEGASLAITGLERSVFQRWSARVGADSDDPQGVFIAWTPDCKKYLAYCKYAWDGVASRTPHYFGPSSQVGTILLFLFWNGYHARTPYENTPLEWQRAIYSMNGTAFAWLRSKDLAALASKKHGLYIIDLSTNQLVQWNSKTSINALAWSLQERVLASGTIDGYILFKTVRGENKFSIKVSFSPIHALAWKPDGTQIAVAHGGEVSVYQVK